VESSTNGIMEIVVDPEIASGTGFAAIGVILDCTRGHISELGQRTSIIPQNNYFGSLKKQNRVDTIQPKSMTFS
jgi:hypothetical protein